MVVNNLWSDPRTWDNNTFKSKFIGMDPVELVSAILPERPWEEVLLRPNISTRYNSMVQEQIFLMEFKLATWLEEVLDACSRVINNPCATSHDREQVEALADNLYYNMREEVWNITYDLKSSTDLAEKQYIESLLRFLNFLTPLLRSFLLNWNKYGEYSYITLYSGDFNWEGWNFRFTGEKFFSDNWDILKPRINGIYRERYFEFLKWVFAFLSPNIFIELHNRGYFKS